MVRRLIYPFSNAFRLDNFLHVNNGDMGQNMGRAIWEEFLVAFVW